MKQAGGRPLVLVLLATVCGFVAGGLGGWLGARAAGPVARSGPGYQPPAPDDSPVAPLPPIEATSSEAASGRAIVAAVKRVRPAVVNIDNLGRVDSPGFNPWMDQATPPGAKAPELRGSGSGFIFDAPQGFAITNQHVVEGAEEIQVTLDDGRELGAELIGADKLSDIAVIKLPAQALPAAPLGRTENLEQGQWVVAIGNPFKEFPHTVTVGVISALNRNMPLPDRDYSNLIQTDAAINMGNSGGPLCNLSGEVIGINSAIFSPTQTYAGLGFAIGIDEAMEIARHLIDHGAVPWLGIAMITLDDAAAARLKTGRASGVFVDQVRPNSPAAKGGLREGDVVTTADGQPVADSAGLQGRVLAGEVGGTLTLKVIRDGGERTVKIKLGARPQE